ncbi:SusC/RagA family TonB-linked outer membrane protein [Bacteroidia bacterium]|nr:SusC/RagA family TonB-linked outer membrane protein [Bacteroidia bacterium]
MRGGGANSLRAEAPQESKIAVTGVVSDAEGPVIGASVVEKGNPGNGTATDVDGKYTLRVSSNATLEVSYLGYATQEIAVNGQTTINVTLAEDAKSLDEVVVVGYGTQKRESLTGALATVSSEKLNTLTTPTIENLLSSKVAGVFVAPGGGRPGDKGNILIRGQSSINGTKDPLWVIDGVIVGTASNNSLNPSDIESLTVLKDAASTAIYGSQGANGVVLVTTKNAAAGKFSVDFSAKFGFNSLSNGNLQVMNGAELYDLFKSFSNQEMIQFPRWSDDLRNANYNWWDLATQTGIAQEYNVSVQSGTEKTKSYFSAGYYDEDGAVRGYNFKRYSLRYRSEFKPFDRITIKPMLAATRRNVDDRQYSVTAMYSNLPWDSPYLPDGEPTPHRSSTWVNSNSTNYLYDLQWNHSESYMYSAMVNLDFDVRIANWLTFSSVNNFTLGDYAYHEYGDPRSNGASGVNGRISENGYKTERRYTNQLLRFNKSWDKHAVNAVAGYEFNDYYYKKWEAIGTGMLNGMELLDLTTIPEKVAGTVDESAMQSVLFNANYAYDSKYLAQVSARRDGASNFGDNAKYGNFYSVSAGYIISKEDFFNVSWVDLLKVRAAYGTVGNKPKSLYPQYDTYSTSGNYDELPAALISQVGNKNLTWEKTATTGIGVDFNFLQKFRLSLDYYNKYTDNILFQVPVSGLVGVTSMWRNIGEMENKGFEVVAGADIIKTQDWLWQVDANIGWNRNKIVKLYGAVEETGIAQGIFNISGGPQRKLLSGYDANTYFLPEWAGVNPDDGAPLWFKTDKETGTRVQTSNYAEASAEASKAMLGSYTPDFFGGFSTSLQWKDVELNAVFGYSVGGKIYNYARMEYDSDGTYVDRNQMKLMDGWTRWEKPGDIATHPVAQYNNSSKSNSTSSRYLEDGSYLKLRTLSLGYNLRLPQYNVQNLRVSVSAENLFCITEYSGVDPEIPVSDGNVVGAAGPAVYPVTRKVMFGINLTF